MAKKAAAKKKVVKKKSSAKKASTRKSTTRKSTTRKKSATRKAAPKKAAPEKKAAPKKAAKPSPPAAATRAFPDLIAEQPDETQLIARRLRGLVLDTLSDVVEAIVGSERVGIALYSRGEATNVLCGIQPVGDACLLYVHNVEQQEGDRFELQGQGKNSRHVRFESLVEVAHDDVRNLLRRVSVHAGS